MSIALQVNGTSILSGQVNFVASTTAESSINIPQGTAPTAPNNGDLWTTSEGVYAFINGAIVGPFGGSYIFNAPLVNTSGTVSILPATSSALGVVQTDGATLSNSSGVIAVVGSALTSLPTNPALYPTLNQNTTGTASNLSGTPALPNGTTATTQGAGDDSAKIATTAYVNAVAAQGQFKGTSTNDNAAAGNIGEYISSTVLIGSAISLTASTPANVTSITLSAGDWDVSGNVAFNPTSSTAANNYQVWTSQTSATVPTIPNNGAYTQFIATVPLGDPQCLNVGTQRISIASPTTVYLSCQAFFTVSTNVAYGFIGARRVR